MAEKVKYRRRNEDGYELRSVGLITKNNGAQVLLVNSRKQRYWIVPGGGVEDGEMFDDAAHREVYEEAGVVCKIIKEFDIITDEIKRQKTKVYELRVILEMCEWPESTWRKRIWMTLKEAELLIKPSHLPLLKLLA